MDKQTGGQTHLAAVGVFHDEAEAVAGLEGVFQCLQGGTRGMGGGSGPKRPPNNPTTAPKWPHKQGLGGPGIGVTGGRVTRRWGDKGSG